MKRIAYFINRLNIKLKKHLTFNEIRELIKIYTTYEIETIDEYIHWIKLAKGLPEKEKEEIRKYVKEITSKTKSIQKTEARIIIQSKLREEVSEKRIAELVDKYEKSDEELKPKYIRYYRNQNTVEEIMQWLEEYMSPKVETLEELQRQYYMISNIIYDYLKDEEFIGYKQYPDELTLKKINKLQDLLTNRNFRKLKQILYLDTEDYEKIEQETEKKIAYLKYIRETELAKKEIDRDEWRRIVNNKIENNTNKHHEKIDRIIIEEYPTDEETQELWEEIYTKNTGVLEVRRDNQYLKEIEDYWRYNMSRVTIPPEMVNYAVMHTANWKTPGSDGIQGYYIKNAKWLYPVLHTLFNCWLSDKDYIPEQYTEGITYLIYKGGETTDPKNYRPITCLNVLTKIFTTILRRKIQQILVSNPIEKRISPSQLGIKKKSLGAKEGAINSREIQDQLNKQGIQYYELYYDIKKAYDTVNHMWLEKTLLYYNIPERIVDTIKYFIKNTTLKMQYNKDRKIKPIQIKRGIVQGDSLSPMLFVLYINILSLKLNELLETRTIRNESGREIKINHIMYMDDLKIITFSQEKAIEANNIVMEITSAIGLQINKSKSGIIAHNGCQIPQQLDDIPVVDEEHPYKYLGTEVADKVLEQATRAEIKIKIIRIMDQINANQTSSYNYIKRIQSMVMGLLRYHIGTVTWPITELDKIDQIIRNKMKEGGMYGRCISLPRLYLSKKEFGQGVPRVRYEYAKEIIRNFLAFAWREKEDINIEELQREWNSFMKISQAIKALRKIITKEQFIKMIKDQQEKKKYNSKKVLQEINESIDQFLIKVWKKQKVVGNLRVCFEHPEVDQSKTSQVWKKINIKRSAYLMVIRMQEGTTLNGSRKAIVKQTNVSKYCKYCPGMVATINHILLSCVINKKRQIQKHDYLAKFIYRKIEEITTISKQEPIEHSRILPHMKLMWNTNIVSTALGEFPKRPDIYLKTIDRGLIIDVAIVADHNIRIAYVKKLNRYRRLVRELNKIEKSNYIIIPVIMTISGLINQETIKQLKRYQINIDWNKVVRDIVVRNMQDLMFYNGVSIEEETDISDVQENTQTN